MKQHIEIQANTTQVLYLSLRVAVYMNDWPMQTSSVYLSLFAQQKHCAVFLLS